MEPLFSPIEINYLLSFMGESDIFGVETIEDDVKAILELSKKGIVEKDGMPNRKTAFVVEMLRVFKKAPIYLHFQNFIFAFSDDHNCIIDKKTYDETSYDQFLVGDYKILWKSILSHPIMKKQNNNLEKDEVENCNLVIEIFDNSMQLLGEFKIEVEENTWYRLNEDFEKETRMEEQEILQWMLEILPSEIAASLKGVVENEQLGK